MVYYRLNVKRFLSEDKIRYTAYGINVIRRDNGECIGCVDDVFIDRENALRFIEKINRYRLSPLHLMDVIEDEFALITKCNKTVEKQGQG